MANQPHPMSRPRGSLKKRSDGQWSARYSAGTDPISGKRMQKQQTFPDQKEARKWLTAELHALDNGARVLRASGGPTLGRFLRDFYANDRRGSRGKLLSERTCEVDLHMLERYVLQRAPTIADTPLQKITTEQLAQLFRSLATGDSEHGALSRATVSRVYRTLTARLTHAVDLGHLQRNPFLNPRRTKKSNLVSIGGKDERTKRTLTELQARAFLEEALGGSGDRYGLLFAVMLWTGLRPGEATGLTWPDVDFDAGVLLVRRSLVRTAGKWELANIKTGRPRRVPIPPQLLDAIRSHRAAQTLERDNAGRGYRDYGFLFCSADIPGEPVWQDTIARRHFKPMLVRSAYRLLERERPAIPPPSCSRRYRNALAAQRVADAAAMRDASFPSISLYELRHTQATMLLRRNVHPKIVAERLGHARVASTLDIYSHVTPDMQAQAVAELESVLGRAA